MNKDKLYLFLLKDVILLLPLYFLIALIYGNVILHGFYKLKPMKKIELTQQKNEVCLTPKRDDTKRFISVLY